MLQLALAAQAVGVRFSLRKASMHIHSTGCPQVGIAFSAYVPQFLEDFPDDLEYVEMPFELLRHDPSALQIAEAKPLILHCASLSMAGAVPPTPETYDEVRHWIEATRTPWLGEHLAFVTAERGEYPADEYAPGEPYNIGYTVNPPANEESLAFVLRSLGECKQHFEVPVLLENAPVYFEPPGGTMSQTELFGKVCACSDALLLLDLAHHLISATTLRVDPHDELLRLPLDKVVEVHISGVDVQDGMHWDDHATRAPDILFDLLATVLEKAPVRAVTLEYNWSMRFPIEVLREEIARAREVLARCGVGGAVA